MDVSPWAVMATLLGVLIYIALPVALALIYVSRVHAALGRKKAGKPRAAMADTEISWEGQSGKEYVYWIHRIVTYFSDEPGNYIYAKEVEPDSWTPLYIGQTSSLEERLADNEKEACARRNGATHVHVHTTRGGAVWRTAEEADLVAKWNPVCNDQGDVPSGGSPQVKP